VIVEIRRVCEADGRTFVFNRLQESEFIVAYSGALPALFR